jgi:hypothetical protein
LRQSFAGFAGLGTAADRAALVVIASAEGCVMNPFAQETSIQISLALGEAVVRSWDRLPHDVQRALFEQTVSSHGERMRPQLAVFLHDAHPRTGAAIKARAILEPDSLGG